MPPRITPLLLILAAAAAPAQPPSPWQGEWGAFTGDHAQHGQRLSIANCGNTTCKFFIQSRPDTGSAGTASEQSLTILSATTATASLPGDPAKPPCVLRFERQPGPRPAIAVTATGEACTSYYAAGGATMSGIYPLRSTTPYSGAHREECFLDNSPARLAVCTHPDLAATEARWESLAFDDPPQPPAGKTQSSYNNEQARQAAILRGCDADRSPATCLAARYSAEIAAMQARKDAYLGGTVERGDPADGHRLAQKIAGRYRHSFPNGDVQGDKYTTTDTLTVRPVGPSSIHFDAELNFFNGHTCSLSGGALFRKDGSFVFDDSPANSPSPDTPACRLAIIPTATGVKFKDINGGCKSYCGARGGWDGAEFTFKERGPGPNAANSTPNPKP